MQSNFRVALVIYIILFDNFLKIEVSRPLSRKIGLFKAYSGHASINVLQFIITLIDVYFAYL